MRERLRRRKLSNYRSGDKECRFDYHFNGSYEEYYIARERFEKVFVLRRKDTDIHRDQLGFALVLHRTIEPGVL
jgi:hypothetical protein